MNERGILGKNLKRFRQAKGLMQKELATKVGLSKDTISKIELGKQENIGLKYLSVICRELDISIEELFIKDPGSITLKLVASEENVRILEKLFAEFKRILMNGKK